ncbi:Scr1 family TA system antitoxin-like transcriptional regulator [Streptomyces sp. NPDC059883]|uniref:Scr1 family TA system antitoxin-like transcriptional regulator n=1 Tax=unclassified Streptomyces TaxID=2593676 RepID=UPI00364AA173
MLDDLNDRGLLTTCAVVEYEMVSSARTEQDASRVRLSLRGLDYSPCNDEEHEHISVRVIPFGTGSYPSSGSGIIYFKDAVPQLDSVQLDTDTFSGYVGAQPQLVRYRAVLNQLEGTALTPEKSRDLMHNVAQSM